jgi:hypothetical protein
VIIAVPASLQPSGQLVKSVQKSPVAAKLHQQTSNPMKKKERSSRCSKYSRKALIAWQLLIQSRIVTLQDQQ